MSATSLSSIEVGVKSITIINYNLSYRIALYQKSHLNHAFVHYTYNYSLYLLLTGRTIVYQ